MVEIEGIFTVIQSNGSSKQRFPTEKSLGGCWEANILLVIISRSTEAGLHKELAH